MKNIATDNVHRIALFVPSLNGGGAERVMVALANAFAARGLPVDLVLANAEGPFLDDVRPDVRVVDIMARRVITSLPGLLRYLRRTRPDVLISAMDHANTVAILATVMGGRGTKAIVTVHSTISRRVANATSPKEKVILWTLKRLYHRAAAVVAVSEGAAKDLQCLTGLEKNVIRVIYNPIPVSTVADRAAAIVTPLWPADDEQPTVLACGRLERPKDFGLLLESFRRVRDNRRVRLIILGEGSQRAMLEERVRKLHLSDDVLMPGWVDNPFAYMRMANLFVSSSLWEGFGNVIAEALASGCPVVATDCPSGPSEILEDGRWGQLVPIDNVAALADAITKGLDAPRPVPTMEYLEKRFGSDVALEQYLSLIDAVTGRCVTGSNASGAADA